MPSVGRFLIRWEFFKTFLIPACPAYGSIMIGNTISHYQILEQLGAGGMGIVYKAYDTKLKREVAIKFLPPEISLQEQERARFMIEAQAAAALNHPNIATIYAIEEVNDELFIVMEYIDGPDLKKEVASDQLPVNSVIDLAVQIAAGLQAAHEKGIVHRDIKPANIMLTSKGQVKITDFGLAKIAQASTLTKAGMTLGTVAYMSPEQAQGLPIDHRTDIWALGVVLYEMLTGALPFRGEYDQAILYEIVNVDPRSIPPDLERPALHTNLQRVVNKALAKKVAERYQQMDEMAQALHAMQKSLAAEAAFTPAPASASIVVFAVCRFERPKRSGIFLRRAGGRTH